MLCFECEISPVKSCVLGHCCQLKNYLMEVMESLGLTVKLKDMGHSAEGFGDYN